MADRNGWQSLNQRYLGLSMEWLRTKLSQAATGARQPSGQNNTHDSAQLDSLAIEIQQLEQSLDPPALVVLAQQFGLSKFEKQLLLLCCAVEFDTSLPAACAAAQGDPHWPYPTIALGLSLLDDPAWDVVAPERPLRYWHMIDIRAHDALPLVGRQLRADERIVNYIKGLNHLDARLLPFVKRMEIDDATLPASHAAIAGSAEAELRSLLDESNIVQSLTVQLAGQDRLGKLEIVGEICRRLGLQPFELRANLLPHAPIDLNHLARLWRRETSLLPVCLFVSAADEMQDASRSATLSHFLDAARSIACIEVIEPIELGEHSIVCDVDKPTYTEQTEVWRDALGAAAQAEVIGQLASQYHLSAKTIRKVVRSLPTPPTETEEPAELQHKLWLGCRIVTRPKLDRLTQRIDVKATWDDLVLPPAQLDLLHQIADQVRYRHKVYDEWGFRKKMNRGLGISALFAGPSGTGKTMAAEVLASDLQLDLVRVDLSAVVNKYIGETEKNLRKLFDAADDGGVILFFDEADALFGKRTEVSDSHDRFANIEVNYLLQRMESYRGLAILASNIKSALDKAFLRRLRFIVDIPLPTAAERNLIWRRAFPPGTPVNNLDYDSLSRLKITGGNIHSISLAASFQSAALHAPHGVSMTLVKSALEVEMCKLEKPTITLNLSSSGESDCRPGAIRIT